MKKIENENKKKNWWLIPKKIRRKWRTKQKNEIGNKTTKGWIYIDEIKKKVNALNNLLY